MSTMNLPGDTQRPVSKADNLTDTCEPAVQKNTGALLQAKLHLFSR
jgi:hypothetical protein